MTEETKLISIPQAAQETGFSEATLRHAARRGYLKATRLGIKTWMVTLADVEDWRNNVEVHKPGPRKK